MGRVFTPEAVQAGHLPEPGAHEAAGQFILNEVKSHQWPEYRGFDLQNYKPDGLQYIGGIMVYGSTACDKATMRSDVDVLFLYWPNRLHALGAARTLFMEAEKQYHTPIEAQPYEIGALFDRLQHTVDPAFAQHLIRVQSDEKWSFNFPVRPLEYTNNPAEMQKRMRPAALRYVANKRRSFAKALVATDGLVDYDRFQRAFEMPNAIGRKVVSLQTDFERIADSSTDKSGNLKTTIEKMEVLSADWSVILEEKGTGVQSYRWLVDKDQEYDAVLQATVESSVSIAEYSQWLQRHYQGAIKRAHDVSHFWCAVLEHNLDTRDKAAEEALLEARKVEAADYDY